MVTLPIPGVAFDLASFSFHVPSCRSAAKDTAPTKEQIATINPIVLIFMALIETGFRTVVNAFLGLPINVEVLVNCQSAGSDQRNVLRAYRSPLPWPGRGEGEGRCSAIGSESLASWQLEFEPLTFILSPFFKRRGGPPTAPADNQRTLPNQRSHGCAIARRRDARTGLGSARVPG